MIMKSINRTLFTSAVAIASAMTVQAEEVKLEGAEMGEWTMDYQAALELAQEKDKPLLLNFTGSDWCGWCKLMDKNVFAQPEWKEFAKENVLLVTIDFPQDKSIVPEKYVERNSELQQKFGVRGYPTYVILDSDGETKLGQLGAGREKTPSSFIEEFKDVTRTSSASVAAYAKENPEKAEAFKKAIEEAREAKKALTDWLATGPQRNEENNKKFAELQETIKSASEKLDEFEQ